MSGEWGLGSIRYKFSARGISDDLGVPVTEAKRFYQARIVLPLASTDDALARGGNAEERSHQEQVTDISAGAGEAVAGGHGVGVATEQGEKKVYLTTH